MFKALIKKAAAMIMIVAVSLSAFPAGSVLAAEADAPEAFAIDLSEAKIGNDYTDATVEADENSFTMTYGTEYQYGDAFVTFPVTLPEGKLLSDYETIEFKVWANGSYGGKKIGVLAEPRGAFPETIDYDYGGTRANNVINIWNGNFSIREDSENTYPAEPTEQNPNSTFNIIRANAALLGTNELDMTIYVHMEHQGGTCQYSVSDVKLIPAASPLNNGSVAPADATNSNPNNKGIMINLDRDDITINLSRALKEGEELFVEAFDADGEAIGDWSFDDTERGVFVITDADLFETMKLSAYVKNVVDAYDLVNAEYKDLLDNLITDAKRYYPGDYENGDILAPVIAEAVEISESSESNNSDYNEISDKLSETLASLTPADPFDASVFADPSTFEKMYELPDIMTMIDGTKVESAEDWPARDKEIRELLQYYIYGIWRGGEDSGEEIAAVPGISVNPYTNVESNIIDITVTRPDREATDTYTPGEAKFTATVTVPEGDAPEGGWPVIIGVGSVGQQEYVLSRGYATVTFGTASIASDDTNRNGAFYQLYPYLNTWSQQTGVLMAWAWGASKIIDALMVDEVFEAYNISATETMVNGVSRNGKAAAIAAAFDERIKVGIPTCSGFPAMTNVRYKSDGIPYIMEPWFDADYPKVANITAEGAEHTSQFVNFPEWTGSGGTELFNSQNGWLNEVYKGFTEWENLPFDMHFLAALCASNDRYLFMVMGIASDAWSAPAGMWWNYENTLPVFELLGIEDHLAINYHPDLHGNEVEDFVKLFAWFEYNEYGTEIDMDLVPDYVKGTLERMDLTLLESLKTSVFASEANAESYEAGKPHAPEAE